MPHRALDRTDHRPWPPPRGPWVLTMDWEDLLFLHWPVEAAALRRLLPQSVELDTFDGRAWLGVVPFRMARTRLRWLPGFPTTVDFAELNVRTYVKVAGRPGVWFFSLDAGSRLVVAAARAACHLPYFRAEFETGRSGQLLTYSCRRSDRRAPPARFAASWCHGGPSRAAAPGTLDHFLVERYCLFVADRRGRPRCLEIAHAPWQLQPASVSLGACDMTRLLGFELPDSAPYALMAEPQTVVGWPLSRAARSAT